MLPQLMVWCLQQQTGQLKLMWHPQQQQQQQ
jgi:hypothetical protein